MRGSSYYSSTDASSETSSDSDDSSLGFAAIRVRPAFFHEDRLLRFAANPSGFRNAITRSHMGSLVPWQLGAVPGRFHRQNRASQAPPLI